MATYPVCPSCGERMSPEDKINQAGDDVSRFRCSCSYATDWETNP